MKVNFNDPDFQRAVDHYDFDADAFEATMNRVSEALGGEPIQRALSVLANLLVVGVRRRSDDTPEMQKQFLTSLISQLIDEQNQ
jgi:hypothetical protein